MYPNKIEIATYWDRLLVVIVFFWPNKGEDPARQDLRDMIEFIQNEYPEIIFDTPHEYEYEDDELNRELQMVGSRRLEVEFGSFEAMGNSVTSDEYTNKILLMPVDYVSPDGLRLFCKASVGVFTPQKAEMDRSPPSHSAITIYVYPYVHFPERKDHEFDNAMLFIEKNVSPLNLFYETPVGKSCFDFFINKGYTIRSQENPFWWQFIRK